MILRATLWKLTKRKRLVFEEDSERKAHRGVRALPDTAREALPTGKQNVVVVTRELQILLQTCQSRISDVCSVDKGESGMKTTLAARQ